LIRQASLNGILAAGMTVIILTGGIDLSIGSLVALCGIFVGLS
jgi:ribose/xylose/arabinose/galactoside ABC-type transport system permease subunit